jgi:Ca-activated chloride channel family protein
MAIAGGSEERLPLSGGQALMEQWLEQIEGDPAQLMQQQFRLEEYRYLRNQGGNARETRPW